MAKAKNYMFLDNVGFELYLLKEKYIDQLFIYYLLHHYKASLWLNFILREDIYLLPFSKSIYLWFSHGTYVSKTYTNEIGTCLLRYFYGK